MRFLDNVLTDFIEIFGLKNLFNQKLSLYFIINI